MMQIGALANVKQIGTAPPEKNDANGSAKGNFAQLLNSVANSNESEHIQLQTMESASADGEKALTDLLVLLKSEGLLEGEDWIEILDGWLAGGEGDFSALYKQVFNEDLSIAIKQEDVSPSSVLEQLLVFFANLLNHSEAEFNKIIASEEGKNGIKALKLLELLGKERFVDSGKLKELLANIENKIEKILVKHPQENRIAYLQKTFSTLANDLKEQPSSAGKGIELTVAEPGSGAAHHFPISKVQQLSLALSQSGRQTSSSELIRQFANIIARSSLSNGGGEQRLTIKLYPEHLGSLRIELIQRETGMIARLLTSTAAARDVLEAQVHSLKQAFGMQNIQVEKIEISQQFTGEQDRYFNFSKDSDSHERGKEQKEQFAEEEKHNEDESFIYTLDEALNNIGT